MNCYRRTRCVAAAALMLALMGCSPDDPGTGPVLRYAYVPNAGDGTVSVIDVGTFAVVKTITVSAGETGSTSHGVGVSADGRRLFVGDATRGLLKMYDTTSYDVLGELDLGIQVHGIDVTKDARRLIASGSRLPAKDRKITHVVDLDTFKAVATLETNISGHGDATSDGKFIYINDIVGHRVAVISLAENAVVKEIIVGPAAWPDKGVGPNEVAFAPGDRTAYTADYDGESLTVLDTSDPRAPTITGSIALAGQPHGIAITPDGREIWVSNRTSKDIAVVDIATRKELARISMTPYSANHVALTPDGKHAWVTLTATDEMTDKTGRIAVLDVASRKELARVTVGVTPHEISFED